MARLTKVISTIVYKAKRRLVKILGLGKSDVQTPFEAMPYGDDSNPIKDMIAIHLPTGEMGKSVIVGYINKNQLAAVGEKRLYSTDAQGNEKAFVWLKNDGSVEVNGNTDNLMKYTPMNAALTKQAVDINTELAKIATAIGTLGGAYIAAPISIDISGAKVDDFKTK